MDFQPLCNRLANRHAWIQRSVRVLEDDLHVAAHFFQLPTAQLEDIRPIEKDLAGGRLDQAQHGAPDGGLSAARFAHQPNGLTLANGKADVIHRLHPGHHLLQQAAADREILHQVFDLDQIPLGLILFGLQFGRIFLFHCDGFLLCLKSDGIV